MDPCLVASSMNRRTFLELAALGAGVLPREDKRTPRACDDGARAYRTRTVGPNPHPRARNGGFYRRRRYASGPLRPRRGFPESPSPFAPSEVRGLRYPRRLHARLSWTRLRAIAPAVTSEWLAGGHQHRFVRRGSAQICTGIRLRGNRAAIGCALDKGVRGWNPALRSAAGN